MEFIKQIFLAFTFGGFLCAVGQLIIDYTAITPARVLVGYVTGGVILGGIGVYKPLVNIFGCGATVPLTGFGNLLSEGVKKAVEKDGLLGALSGGITGAAVGIGTAVLAGFLTALTVRSKTK